MPKSVHFELLRADAASRILRAEVPGGWLLLAVEDVPVGIARQIGLEWRSSICFMPDPDHLWLREEEEH